MERKLEIYLVVRICEGVDLPEHKHQPLCANGNCLNPITRKGGHVEVVSRYNDGDAEWSSVRKYCSVLCADQPVQDTLDQASAMFANGMEEA